MTRRHDFRAPVVHHPGREELNSPPIPVLEISKRQAEKKKPRKSKTYGVYPGGTEGFTFSS